ncbi:MAG TPA: S46 family peptidase [Chitinophagaceae bacterium]|nr:S46 family peptidase [Chitinophagaceae bacterium]
MKMCTKKTFLSIALLVSIAGTEVSAQGGMWPPNMLKSQEEQMTSMGLEIPVSRIYGEDPKSLNNAIALFGRGCSSEIISSKGLLLTNHHCAYSQIQSLSTPERNILLDGYWASNHQEELPVPGLTVRFIRKMEDVTSHIIYDLNDTMPLDLRASKIERRITKLEKSLSESSGLSVEIKPFYYGNKYQAVYVEVFEDVRLVGTPPNGIGKFGADTDNWTWPRMTGDFALVRIYADENNNPAPYSATNKPYRPKAYFPISTKGVEEDDFTMVYGFPYQTQQYISSYQLGLIEDYINPIRISSRAVRLEVLDDAMRRDPNIFLKYAAKQSSISNGYKKWQGELQGLASSEVKSKKEAQEKRFNRWVVVNDKKEYSMLLPQMRTQVEAATPYIIKNEYLQETILSVEIIRNGRWLKEALETLENDPQNWENIKWKISKEAAAFYKDYDWITDKKVFEQVADFYFNKIDVEPIEGLLTLKYNAGNDEQLLSNFVYGSSALRTEDGLTLLFDKSNEEIIELIKRDPAYVIYNVSKTYQDEEVKPKLDHYNMQMAHLNRIYMKAQLEFNPERKPMFPDANQTMRITYGQVKSIDLGTSNISVTTLDDLIPRHNEQIEEFNIPFKLRSIYDKKDFGRWERNQTVPINFIATNHTSGGNSGSPVLNGKGELIGLNFDRIWQGTMSDLHFDPSLSRNISVDIVYVLFIIEKYGDAAWILKELDLRK